MSAGLLDRVVAATRARIAERARAEPPGVMAERAASARPRADRFTAALVQPNRIAIIAECKRASPSRGELVQDYDPARTASAYERAGAAAISVLTEPEFFGGSLEHLAAVRRAVSAPLLRKDFIIDEYQLLEARAYGADAVLLIVAALHQDVLVQLHRCAGELGMAALVEVHDEEELARALGAEARVVGVNNRDLRTLSVDLDVCLRLASLLPRRVVAVAESGITSARDLEQLYAAGYSAALVGERLVTAPDPGAALHALRAPIAVVPS